MYNKWGGKGYFYKIVSSVVSQVPHCFESHGDGTYKLLKPCSEEEKQHEREQTMIHAKTKDKTVQVKKTTTKFCNMATLTLKYDFIVL